MKTYRKSQNTMFLCGMHATTLMAVLVLMLVVIGEPAHAAIQVIDFEDLAVPPGGNNIGGDRTSGGFFFDLSSNHTHLMNDAFGLGNGTTYLVADDYQGIQTMTISPVGGGTFPLQSIDFGEAVNTGNTHATFVEVTGNLSGGGVVTKLVTLDLVFDGPGGVNDFQTEVFNWTNLVNVVLDGGGPNSYDYYGIDNIVILEPTAPPVAVDIKPGSCPNPLNVRSRGILPVAILASEEFDVNTIDRVSLRLADVAPARSSYEDVAGPVLDANDCNCTTDGPDGYIDLILKFRIQEIVEQLIDMPGGLADGQTLGLNLTGELFDDTSIVGSDCMVLVGNVSKWLEAKRWDGNEDGVVNLLDLAELAENWLQSSFVED